MRYTGKFTCSSYQEAVDLLAHARDKDYRPIGNNTYLIRQDNGDISIRHHQTDIITFKKNGHILLDSNGYHTPSTGARYRAFLGIAPWSYKGEWVVDFDNILYKFDGIDLNPQLYSNPIKGIPVILDSIQILLKKKIPDTAALIREIKAMPVDLMLKVWKKFKNHRAFLAKYCTPEFLPLTMATAKQWWDERDEVWSKIVNQRLREDK